MLPIFGPSRKLLPALRFVQTRAVFLIRRGSMSSTCDRAERYRHRAEECIQFIISSQTPGTGEIYLQLAERYLLLAELEIRKAIDPTQSMDH